MEFSKESAVNAILEQRNECLAMIEKHNNLLNKAYLELQTYNNYLYENCNHQWTDTSSFSMENGSSEFICQKCNLKKN